MHPFLAGRSSYDSKYPNNTSNQPWFSEVCPTQTTLHSCYYHGNVTLARILERRSWVTTDSKCASFHPMEFLELIRNRRIIIIGDSMLTQMWQALTCILYGATEQKLYVHWAKMWRCNSITCPGGSEQHSNCYGGVMRFPFVNATIIDKKMYKYTKEYFFGTLRRLKLSSRDVVLINFGMHYNVEKEYQRVISQFANDLKDEKKAGLPLHHAAFLETTPQHYANGNGYFSSGQEYGNSCVPLQQPGNQAQLDWRNRIVHSVFTDQSSLQIIQLAFGLYSQFDAHVALEPYPTPPWLDCTHWCFPSGALRYLTLIIFNGIRRLIGKASYDRIQDAYSNIALLDYPDGSLIKGSSRTIYLMKDQKKCQFADFNAFRRMGFDVSNVASVPDQDLDKIANGPDIK